MAKEGNAVSSWRPPVADDDGQKDDDVSTRSGNNFCNYLDIESAEIAPSPRRPRSSHAIKAVEGGSDPNPNVPLQTDDFSRLDLTNHDHL